MWTNATESDGLTYAFVGKELDEIVNRSWSKIAWIKLFGQQAKRAGVLLEVINLCHIRQAQGVSQKVNQAVAYSSRTKYCLWERQVVLL